MVIVSSEHETVDMLDHFILSRQWKPESAAIDLIIDSRFEICETQVYAALCTMQRESNSGTGRRGEQLRKFILNALSNPFPRIPVDFHVNPFPVLEKQPD
jgi:hypothetical protein